MSKQLVRSLKTMTSAKPKFTPNKYFLQNNNKDVWSLTNETAAQAANNAQNSGRELINLGQGFFSYSPPAFAIKEVQKAVEIPLVNQYSPTRGRPSLINALINLYSPFYKQQLTPDNILVTTGANEGILSCLMGILNPGDEVIVLEPFFDQYIPDIELCGGKVVYVPINPPKDLNVRNTKGSEWTINFQQFKNSITEKTKAVIINTPHNPIGKTFTKEELTELGNICVKYNVIIISDEVYEHLYFVNEFPRIATLSPEIGQLTLSVGSAGKSFAATGWRIGWVVSLNPSLLQYAAKAHTRICFASPSPIQEACAHSIDIALETNYFENMRKEYEKKFEIFTSVFDELGLPYTIPEGSYFVLVNFSKVKIPSDYTYPEEIMNKGKDFRISNWLINELGVVAIPPTEFYVKEHEHAAENLLRFAVCKDDEYLEKAVERLRQLKEYI